MKDQDVIIVSTLLLLGWALLRTIDSLVGDNAGTALQLIATLLIIVAVALLVFRSFQIARERVSPRKT